MPHDTVLPASDRRHGNGPTLVFLHYWGGSGRTWGPVRDRLAGRDSIAIDHRGWGRSRDLPGPFSLAQLAADTTAVLRTEGITDFVLVGHSLGGKVAQLIAASRPAGLRGLVLVGSGPAKPAAMVTPEYQAGLSHAYDSSESVIGARDAVLTATRLPVDLAEQVVVDSLASGSVEARTAWPMQGIAEDITTATRAITVRTLVIAGQHDRVEPVDVLRENLLSYLADGEFLELPDTGHLIPLEAPDALTAAIVAFTEAILIEHS
ncbi:alpha/beta hydrolase [Curtobacterium sp. 'Ferrero']|uniref:alpha/beta fold hydrolase n=1 Tax=Curtobacterium sp. 'Ferrero' TaxID=2033654 RepID=UPI000BCA4571|nr:alpha/beta hydrolase [Curtobacterium sp. 'Ferrero']PCN47951.1 alpha/beta hydrolase [Curtobacterium sp. 'Ferrero']